MAHDPDKSEFESIGPVLRIPEINQYKPPEIDPSILNIRPLEKIESTLDDISKNLKEQTKLLSEILKELKTK